MPLTLEGELPGALQVSRASTIVDEEGMIGEGPVATLVKDARISPPLQDEAMVTRVAVGRILLEVVISTLTTIRTTIGLLPPLPPIRNTTKITITTRTTMMAMMVLGSVVASQYRPAQLGVSELLAARTNLLDTLLLP